MCEWDQEPSRFLVLLLLPPSLCKPAPLRAADGVLVSKGELRVPDNAPKGKTPLTIPGAAQGGSAQTLKANSRSSLLAQLAAAPAMRTGQPARGPA